MTKAKQPAVRKTLTREQILSADDIRTEWVPVPEWGEDAELLVSGWTARTRDRFDTALSQALSNGEKDRDVRGIFIALSVVDPDTREPLFEVEDIEALTKKSSLPINRLFNIASGLNPLSDTVIENAAKNL
jgi:hypothetical protein